MNTRALIASFLAGSVCIAACSAAQPNRGAAASGGSAGTGSPAAGNGGSLSGGGFGGSAGVSGSSGSQSAAGSPGASGGSAGAASTGGSPGAGGGSASSGGQSSAGSAGTGGSATGCTGMPLCDDFESAADTVGATPTGWTLLNPGGCSGSAQYSAVIDTSQFHSGGKSVKVSGGDSCGPLLLNTSAFASITGGEVYGRFYVRMPSTTAFDHAVLMTLGLAAGADQPGSLDQATHLQLAPEQIGTTSALVWQTTDGNILPAKAPAAAPTTTFPTADTWTCIEFHVSANTQAIETWVDGNAISGLTFIPGTTATMPGLNDQWTPAALAPKSLGLGWIVFSAPAISLWFDDAALAGTRIHCN
jgi:Cip1-like, core domain